MEFFESFISKHLLEILAFILALSLVGVVALAMNEADLPLAQDTGSP